MSWGVLPWDYPVWDSVDFLDLGGYFLPHFREVFNYYLLKYFLMPFLFILFWETYDSNVGAFNPFTFKVITDKYDPVAIYFIVLVSNLYIVFVFPVQRLSFSIYWRAGLVVQNSLSFCLSIKLLIN